MGTADPVSRPVTMKSLVFSSLLSVALAAPTTHVNSGLPAGPLTAAFGDAVQTPKGLRSYALEGFSEDINQDGFVDPIGQAVVVAPVTYTVPQVAPISYTVPQVVPAAAPAAVETEDVKVAPVVQAPSTYTVPHVANPFTYSVPHVVSAVNPVAPISYTVPQVVSAVAPVEVKTGVVPASTEALKVHTPVIHYSAVTPVKYEVPALKYASAPVVQVINHGIVPVSGVPFLSGVVPAVAAQAVVDTPVVEEVGDAVEAV